MCWTHWLSDALSVCNVNNFCLVVLSQCRLAARPIVVFLGPAIELKMNWLKTFLKKTDKECICLLPDVPSVGPAVLSAPLQTVLDNLDVLEELVILLDPESHGVKNTKHLASHCSFPSTWITYSYSMKDSKSPLKAVLEGVTSRHPEWTVEHLAKMLRLMERNDAIAALAKLKPNQLDV